ncbi:MAG: hypothetical protein HGA76_04110 [Candidatus Firestonebacteria bacterium]|nr:hypothetical protein [Candidatus Firestonebacteria bacterium]
MSMEWMSPLVNLARPVENQSGGTAPAVKTQAGVEKACRDFEAYFTASLFSEMSKTLEIEQKQGPSGQQAAWMWNLAGQTVAQELSRGEGLGLKQQLMQALSRSVGLSPSGLD